MPGSLKEGEGYRFRRDHRLRSRREFLRVYEKGKRLSSKHLILHYLSRKDDGGGPRLGITVTKKCGKAVRRNRWKRLIREVYRLHRQKLPAADFVVTVKRGVDIPAFQELERELLRLWRRAADESGHRGLRQ